MEALQVRRHRLSEIVVFPTDEEHIVVSFSTASLKLLGQKLCM